MNLPENYLSIIFLRNILQNRSSVFRQSSFELILWLLFVLFKVCEHREIESTKNNVYEIVDFIVF